MVDAFDDFLVEDLFDQKQIVVIFHDWSQSLNSAATTKNPALNHNEVERRGADYTHCPRKKKHAQVNHVTSHRLSMVHALLCFSNFSENYQFGNCRESFFTVTDGCSSFDPKQRLISDKIKFIVCLKSRKFYIHLKRQHKNRVNI